MIDDPRSLPTMRSGDGTTEHVDQAGSVARTAQTQVLAAPLPTPPRMVVPAPPRLRPGMTPEEIRAYIESTRQRSSRQKQRPSLVKYEDLLRDLVKGKAVMKQVFDDLIETDPAVLEEFGPEGHRAFNACVKRMFS